MAFIALSIIFFILPRHSSSIRTEALALLSFKQGITASSFPFNWNSNQSTCLWQGIKCGRRGSPSAFHVVKLSLPNAQLSGQISPELGTLPHLRHIDLSSNFLNGTLPESIFNATQLECINIANNSITGELPESIATLKNLWYLNISSNFFVGGLPRTLTTMRNLTVISVRGNYFSGTIPSGFESLHELDLSSNLFNGSLPANLGGEKLLYLNLSYNNINGAIPSDFAAGVSFNSTVDLSYNSLAGAIPESEIFRNENTSFFAGNLDLCGEPLKILCSQISSPRNDPSPSSSHSSPSSSLPVSVPADVHSTSVSNGPKRAEERESMKPETIAEIVAGDIAGVVVIAGIFVYVYQLKRKKLVKEPSDRDDQPKCGEIKALGSCMCLARASVESSAYTESEGDDEKGGEGNMCPRFEGSGEVVMVDGETKLEVDTILRAAAFVISASGKNIVYKAVLDDGRTFAVRRMAEIIGSKKMKEFGNQVRIIARLQHPNILRVRGFYWGDDEKLLISDFISNGSLASFSTPSLVNRFE